MNLTNHPIICGSKATIDTMRSIFISSDLIDTIWYIWVVSPCILWTQFQLQDVPWLGLAIIFSTFYFAHNAESFHNKTTSGYTFWRDLLRPRKQIDLFFGKVKVMWYQSQWWLWIRTKSNTLLLLDRITALTLPQSKTDDCAVVLCTPHSLLLLSSYHSFIQPAISNQQDSLLNCLTRPANHRSRSSDGANEWDFKIMEQFLKYWVVGHAVWNSLASERFLPQFLPQVR